MSIAAEGLYFLGGSMILTWQILRELLQGKFYFKLLIDQILYIGVKSLPLIGLTALSVGMVMALQYGEGLEKYGGKLYVPKLVAITVVKEMGPVFSSLMLAARVGSGMASEIGSMAVTQQIDAVRALGTSPIARIVIPRVLGCLISLPLLVGLANVIGIIGGLIVASTELGLDPQFYIQKVISTVKVSDYLSGFSKTFFFALFIAISACYYGLNVKEGTRGVGSATTKAVVTASIFILVGDYFLSKLFFTLQKWY